jgi:LysB family phage lysis regulatory protein
MSALLLDPIAKLVIALLIILSIFFGFKHYNGLNQKIGVVETQLSEKQTLIESQSQTIQSIQEQISSQAQAIFKLQKVQDELQLNSEQRKITLKEIINHDPDVKSWASQPVPDAIRSMFNSPGTATTFSGPGNVSSAHAMP